jgi:fructose-bisphosphate aldolase class II
LKL